jgi:3-methylfumaryl-CoA hydratase
MRPKATVLPVIWSGTNPVNAFSRADESATAAKPLFFPTVFANWSTDDAGPRGMTSDINGGHPMTALDDADVARWRMAVGRTAQSRECLGAEPLRRFALAIGADPAVETVPPPLAHWAYFLPAPADGTIGPDGHPERGDFLPPVSLPRRMFAAGAMEFLAPLALEREARLDARIADVSHKRGRTGDLVFVEVERTVAQDGAPRVRERQSYVYRDWGEAAAMPEPLATPPFGETWLPEAVNLFRFSAATFNGHRIHYDLPYAREVEGYPALVVHGPFTAARLAALALREGPLARFAFRAMAPLFLGQPIYLRKTDEGVVEAVRCDGIVAMRAEFTRR